ncbi:MAG: hypothetical protein VX642_01140 [Bdellovibrionota bacterium]|nr:hypothetical protein [Bdellovibrionota bacterium]
MSGNSWRPEYRVLSKNENQLEVRLNFSSSLDFFKGHFKDFKIVPGVVQSHVAVFLSQELWDLQGFPMDFPSIKFMNPIFPDMDVVMLLEKNPSKALIQFEIQSPGKVHAKGSWKL